MKKQCLFLNNFLILFVIVLSFAQNFVWLDNNDLYDCVAGISYNGTPISMGVFFDINLLLTSANPIQPYMDNLKKLKVHAITGNYEKSTAFQVTCATTPYIVNRENVWKAHGLDGRHSSAHDLLILYVHSTDYCLAPEAENASYRHAFSVGLALPSNRIRTYEFDIPGFGYMDKDHITRMDDLEVEIFKQQDMALVDCDEYVPEDWGRFICLKNVNNVTGVQSGSPLLHKSLVYGIGSFSVQLGSEKIFVFTDIRDYVSNLNYCFKPEDKYYKWWSRYWPKKL